MKTAVAAIQPLSATERQQLLVLMEHLEAPAARIPPHLSKLNQEFWQGVNVQELRRLKQPIVVERIQDLAADFWPVEDSIDDFLGFLQQQRQVMN
ncbi:MAG: hypothetical protein F6J87_28070 [Spirulina sp. SIO3F2]|nr:hypothetical protein [Spirulina sp. SIO3F2]